MVGVGIVGLDSGRPGLLVGWPRVLPRSCKPVSASERAGLLAPTCGSLTLASDIDMLEEFAYLGEEKARELVITNPQRIADRIEEISPIRSGKYPPIIEDSDKNLREICYRRAHELYGEELLPLVKKGLCGAVYTQLSDVEDETNGLLSFDREVRKLKPEELRDLFAMIDAAIREK